MKLILAAFLLATTSVAQVYSPSVLLRNQPDPTDPKRFATTIVENAGATTPRERAEAVWRFFLTDGRFVKPGFWYHIAGWAYEEPTGEVLDPLKLLNSYGFGLCYHIAPLLEAVFEAAGFEDARVWFLTGHTVAEVYYEGAYHYFDSDMMGYNVAGTGSFRGKPVLSVMELAKNPDIIASKLAGPRDVKAGTVDSPWYPADVRAGAMADLSRLFTTTQDNYVFPFTRYSMGHNMNYVLRPGEKIVRYFAPETPSLFYLPYAYDGERWSEFPREIRRYGIRTANGPRSQKDDRNWATGRIEYRPPVIPTDREIHFDMPSPWVIIDANITARITLRSAGSSLSVETSTDGRTWHPAGSVSGPFDGEWKTEPHVFERTANGRRTAASGSYGYQVRVKRSGAELASISALSLTTRFQVNPRSLPELAAGENQLVYRAGQAQTREFVDTALEHLATASLHLKAERGQAMLCPESGSAQTTLKLPAETAFDFGARFLEIRDNLAPDKLTAETRATGVGTRAGTATIEWALSPNGPWRTAWSFPSASKLPEGANALRWPEAFVSVPDLPAGTRAVFVRLITAGPCIDNVRASAWRKGTAPSGRLRITHRWTEGGTNREHVETVSAGAQAHSYTVRAGAAPHNESVIFEALP